MTVNNRFGILLAEKRIKERRGISLQEVANNTGVSRKTLWMWENNRVNRFDVSVIDALCTYFDIEAGELIQFIRDQADKPKADKITKRKPRAKKE
jgi:putative transcriptional regulator